MRLRNRNPARRPAARASLIPVLALLLAATLTACGSDDGGDEDLAAAGSTGGAVRNGADGEQDEAILAFYQCLRDQGVDVEDPDPNQQGIRLNLGELGLDNPEGKAALEACRDLLPGGGPGGGQMDAEGIEAMREFTQCLRDNGIDMPDPSSDGSLTLPPGVDPESSEFQAAMEECQHLTAGHGVRMRGGGQS